nr:PREDICTED: 39S ribosomal protein L48, mitochondrial [Bemisia tabaci]
MALRFLPKIPLQVFTGKLMSRSFSTSKVSLDKIYEPDYLKLMESPIPMYDRLNIQIKGYDYPVLESYQKFVHHTAEAMLIDVEDGWALPPQHLKVKKFMPRSAITDSEYDLKIYERNVQISDVYSHDLSLFLEIIEAALPEGVKMHVHEHLPEHEKVRYIPDSELKQLEIELEAMGGPRRL